MNKEDLQQYGDKPKKQAPVSSVEVMTTEQQAASDELLKHQYALEYLLSTDWIISKISEHSLLGKPIDELKSKYNNELLKREESRITLNGG